MKNAVIFSAAAVGAAVAIGLVLQKRAAVQSALAMDEKVHQLQEKFMSLDESKVYPHNSSDKLEQWHERAG